MYKNEDDFFKDSVIDDTIIGLPGKEYVELEKCFLCGRKLHYRSALIMDDYDGMSVAGKRCGCCGAIYLTDNIIRALLIACNPHNLKLNYKKDVRYERFTLNKAFGALVKRKDVMFVIGKHNSNIFENEGDDSRKGGKVVNNKDAINELEETVEW